MCCFILNILNSSSVIIPCILYSHMFCWWKGCSSWRDYTWWRLQHLVSYQICSNVYILFSSFCLPIALAQKRGPLPVLKESAVSQASKMSTLLQLFFCAADQCSQAVDIGTCDSVVPSWFYNSTSGECEMFNYGGCGGNENRFETERECQAECEGKEQLRPTGTNSRIPATFSEGTCSYGGGEVQVGGTIPADDGCNTWLATSHV